MSVAYCPTHGRWKDDDGACPACLDDLVADNPEAAKWLRGRRRWHQVADAVAAIGWILFAVAGVAFAMVREWRIWSR